MDNMENISKSLASLGVCAVAGILAWHGCPLAAGLLGFFGMIAIWQ